MFALAAVAVSVISSYVFPQVLGYCWVLGTVGAAVFVTGGQTIWRWFAAACVIGFILLPATYILPEREYARAREARKAQDQRAAIEREEARRTAEKTAKPDADQAALDFPQNARTYRKEIIELRNLVNREHWDSAARFHGGLEVRLQPLFKSRIANQPEVTTLKSELSKLGVRIKGGQNKEQLHEAAIAAANADVDLEVVRHAWEKGGFGTVAVHRVTIRNNSKIVAYSDIEYVAKYSAPSGTEVDSNTGAILDVIRAGRTRTFEVNAGFVHSQANRAGFRISGAKKIRP